MQEKILEILVIGQDTTTYGSDLDGRVGLHDLFDKLDNTPGGSENYDIPSTYNANQNKYVFRTLYTSTKKFVRKSLPLGVGRGGWEARNLTTIMQNEGVGLKN